MNSLDRLATSMIIGMVSAIVSEKVTAADKLEAVIAKLEAVPKTGLTPDEISKLTEDLHFAAASLSKMEQPTNAATQWLTAMAQS